MNNKKFDALIEAVSRINERLKVVECPHKQTVFEIHIDGTTTCCETCLGCGKKMRTFLSLRELLNAEKESLEAKLREVNGDLEKSDRGII